MNWTVPPDMEWEPYKKLTKARQARLERLAAEWIYHNGHGGPKPVLTDEEVWK